MKRFRITARNYRAFSDSDALCLELGPGITSIVGRNNIGKSAALLLLYELRQLFKSLSDNAVFIANDDKVNISYPQEVVDPLELFHNANERDLFIEIEILDKVKSEFPNAEIIFKITGCASRNAPNSWEINGYTRNIPNEQIKTRLTSRKFSRTTQTIVEYQHGQLVDCTDMHAAMAALANTKYIGSFRNAVNQGAGAYFDLQIGTAFVEIWNTWKVGGNKTQARAISKVTEDIRGLFEFDSLDIAASLQLKTLIVNVNNQPYRLAELGSGLSQFILALGNAATNLKAAFLLIDEPETNLHPSLQIDFLLALSQYASVGVIFSTHSIGLARSVSDQIYSIQKLDKGRTMRPFSITPNYAQFLGELSFSSFKDLGSDRIVLVEGVNDVKVVQQFLRFEKKEHTTVVLPLGGDQLAAGGREQELEQITRLSNNVFALVDSEKPDASSPPSERRQKFLAVCKSIGIKAHLLELRAIENYLSDQVIPPFLGDLDCRIHAAVFCFNFWTGVIPPSPMLGRSLL